MAVIVEKDERGKPAVIKSVAFPPTLQELKVAEELDALLAKRIPEIEAELIQRGLLRVGLPSRNGPAKGGSVLLWYEVGGRLQAIVEDTRLVKPAERRWLWKAIRMYATRRILRKDRGNSRLHLEYCYRVSKLPWSCVHRLQWDDWVYLLDSTSFRQEPRADEWIQSRVEELSALRREEFRGLVQCLNAALKKKDTSILTTEELFSKYDAALAEVKYQQAC